MSRSSYLGRLASRSAPNPPGLVPAARPTWAVPVTPFEETVPTASGEAVPIPPATRRPESSPEPVELPAAAPGPATRPEPTARPREPSDEPEPRPAATGEHAAAQSVVPDVAPEPGRSPADFVFETPRRPREPEPQRVTGDEDARIEPEAVAPAPPAPKTRTEPVGPARGAAAEWAPIDPDPVAAALADAVRWTSSAPTPRPPAPTAEPASARPPVRNGRTATVAAPPQGEGRPGATRQTATTPPRASERFADVHIGSIEVEIVSPPGAPRPEPAAAVPETPRTPAVPLARKVTSCYGLHQR